MSFDEGEAIISFEISLLSHCCAINIVLRGCSFSHLNTCHENFPITYIALLLSCIEITSSPF